MASASKTLVIGVDPSSKKIALVARHPLTNTFLAQSYLLAEKPTMPYKPENCAEAMYAMHDYLNVCGRMTVPSAPKVAFVESPLIGRGGPTTTMKQAFISGVIQACLIQAGFTVHMVNVQTWKAEVCGNGHATKQDVAKTVKQRWVKLYTVNGGDGDIIDAAAICLYGQGVVARS